MKRRKLLAAVGAIVAGVLAPGTLAPAAEKEEMVTLEISGMT